jgi:ribosomal peptide maturation radical SAM protein 1
MSASAGRERAVLLVQMPWANATLPSLAVGLLSSILRADGLACDSLYANVASVEWLGGWEHYDRFSAEAASELVFTPVYYAYGREDAARRLSEHFDNSKVNEPRPPDVFLDLIDRADRFIAHLADTTPWERYDIVGFSLTFQQTMASLALARALKKRRPDITIVFGGASCDGEMGPEMLRAFPEIDVAVVGEADNVIAPLVRAIRAGTREEFTLTGVAWRDQAGGVRMAGQTPPTQDLGALPAPDYDEYFAALRSAPSAAFRPRLYLEQSRGCWYGAKNACSFCGLSEMRFRSKPAERALEELLELAERYHLSDFYFSDNILDHRYYKTLLPALGRLRHQDGFDFTLFYELKSNVKKWHVESLAAAGVVMVQIGIESLNDHILQLMHKGVTAIQQVQALKLLHEHGITAVWNILYGNPGELPGDYLEMARLIPFVHHLPPPKEGQIGPMVLQRFSRYWSAPDQHGITNIRPLPIYDGMFNGGSVDRSRLAAFFEYDHPDQQKTELQDAWRTLFAALDEWRNVYRPDSLIYTRGPGWIQVVDRRVRSTGSHDKAVVTRLRGLQAEIVDCCEEAQDLGQVQERVAGRAPEKAVEAFLDMMVDRRILYKSANDRYLSLPIHRRA